MGCVLVLSFDDPRGAAMVVSMVMLACVEDCWFFRLPFLVDNVCDSPLDCVCEGDRSASTVLGPDVVELDEDGLGVLDCDDVPR